MNIMAKGNPNPSPATRFKAGKSGNPSGKSTKHQKAEHRAAEISAILRAAALSSLQEKVEAGEISALDAINSDMLRLFRDSEDRAHGTPKQSVEHAGEGGGPLVVKLVRFADDQPPE